jgi:uncharacterized protein (TIGR02611 family)
MVNDSVPDTPPPRPASAPEQRSRWHRLLNQTPDDFQRRRERHRRRPMAVRIGVVIAGGILAIPGAILALPVPDVGIPLLIVGLGLLSLEFDWAARLLGRIVRLAASVRMWFKRLSRPRRILTGAVGLALIVLLVWFLTLR